MTTDPTDALTLDKCAILLGDYAVDLDNVAERLVQLRHTAGDPWMATNLEAAEQHLRAAWVLVRQAVTTLNDVDKP